MQKRRGGGAAPTTAHSDGRLSVFNAPFERLTSSGADAQARKTGCPKEPNPACFDWSEPAKGNPGHAFHHGSDRWERLNPKRRGLLLGWRDSVGAVRLSRDRSRAIWCRNYSDSAGGRNRFNRGLSYRRSAPPKPVRGDPSFETKAGGEAPAKTNPDNPPVGSGHRQMCAAPDNRARRGRGGRCDVAG